METAEEIGMKKQQNRKEELEKIVGEDEIIQPLIEEIIFLEGKLEELKKHTFLKVHPEKPEIQKATPAAKQYKEFLQQYLNCIKVLEKIVGDDEEDGNSALRMWVMQRVNKK